MFYRIWLVPVGVTLMVPATFVVTYFMAVVNDHVDPVFPYISDTGTEPPESCVFGQLLNMSALLVGLCMYLRHREIIEFHRKARVTNVWLLRISTGLLWLGYLSTFGLTMVANFQESNWFSAHILGAMFAFGFGLLYVWGQTVIGWRMRKPLDKSPCLTPIRFTLCLLTTIFFVTMGNAGFFLVLEGTPPYRLKPGHKHYLANLIATTCEWFMVICFIIFFITFAFELRHAVLTAPKLILNIEDWKMPHDASVLKPKTFKLIQTVKNDEKIASKLMKSPKQAPTLSDNSPNKSKIAQKETNVANEIVKSKKSSKKSVK